MMKMIFAVLAMFSFGAQAADQLVEVNGKPFNITDIDNMFMSAEKKIEPGAFYISARPTPFDARLPNVEKTIKARFEAAGLTVTDKIEEAKYGLAFYGTGSLNMVRAEQGLGQAAINVGKVSGGISAMVGSMAANGVSGGVGYVIGAFIPQDEEVYLEGWVFENPTLMPNGKLDAAMKDMHGNKMEISYSQHPDKDKQPMQEDVLAMAIDQWIQRYVVKSPEKTAEKTVEQK